MSKIRVAVFGASGYAGEELLRLLLRHNQAEIAAITSRKNAGEPVSTVSLNDANDVKSKPSC